MVVQPLHTRASDDLAFIRATMQRAGAFTAVPGKGGVLMGAVGLLASVAGSRVRTAESWLLVWLAAAVVAVVIGGLAMARKTRAAGADLLRGKGARFVLGLAPPLLAGAILTGALWTRGLYDMLPGVWLLLYGTATVTGGIYSVRAVPIMGACFVALGLTALMAPGVPADLWLGAGFGVLQIVFGAFIARRHGG